MRCSSSAAVSGGVFLNPNEVILGEPIALRLLSFLPASRLPSASYIIHSFSSSFFLRNKEIRDQKQPRILMGCLFLSLVFAIPSKCSRSADTRSQREGFALPAKQAGGERENSTTR